MNLLEQIFENVFSFLFDSPKEKKKRKLKLAFEKRIQACINGSVSPDSMSICEKIACELPRDANDCKDPEILLKHLLEYCRSGSNVVNMELGKDYWPCNVQRELSTLLEWKVLGPAMRIGLYYLLEKWDGTDMEVIKKYVRLIVGANFSAGFIEKFMEKAESHGGITSAKEVAEICLQAPNMGHRRAKYWKQKIGGMNRALRNRDMEQKKILRAKHCQELEDSFSNYQKSRGVNGGYSEVHTGDEYEQFVMFCVKDTGHVCKKVGGTGDYGADLIVDVNGKSLVIQCKFYSAPVGYDAIQQVYAAKSIYKGSWCCVVSNAGFTRQAIVGGKKLGVKLLSHVDIAEYLKSLQEHC